MPIRRTSLRGRSLSDSFVYSKRRTKTDWAGISLGDAFKPYLEYVVRIPAQRMFYESVRKIQKCAAQLAGAYTESGFQPFTKPQISPCYTSYPATLAAFSAVGLTGFLEFQARVTERILLAHLRKYLKDPAAADAVNADPEIYKRLAESVARSVQTRLVLDDLAGTASMNSVEMYRLFAASQQSAKYRSLVEIVNAVVLYGDILPDWEEQELHPMTRSLLNVVVSASLPFFRRLEQTAPHKKLELGAEWVRAICTSLDKFLPKRDEAPIVQPASDTPDVPSVMRKLLDRIGQRRFSKAEPSREPEQFGPLDGPTPPTLFDPPTASEQILQSLAESLSTDAKSPLAQSPPDVDEGTKLTLEHFSSTLQRASGQENEWEDMRSDLVEQILRGGPFSGGPIEGNPTDGHQVTVRMGDSGTISDQIFDRPIELSDDWAAYAKLLEEAEPLTAALRRSLYPNIEQAPESDRLRTTGSIDPSRLAMSDFASTVFRRYRIHQKADRRGAPVLLIACDGSASLNQRQMRMTKVLATAWLNSTTRSGIKLLAGLYHSGPIRQGVSGPLVQWLYHPLKTTAISRRDAARGLVGLPETGTGAQSDALSLAFMMQEARRLARGRMIYMIVISDCEWNTSFRSDKGGHDEVYSFFQGAYRDLNGKLHTTLVALGVGTETGFEDLLDKVIKVSDEELSDCSAVAQQIAIYVASCISAVAARKGDSRR